MFSLLGDVKGLIKLDKLCIDNNVFRLHYKVSKARKIKIKCCSGNLHHPVDRLHSGHCKAIHGSVTAKFCSQSWYWYLTAVENPICETHSFFGPRRPNWLHCWRCCAFGRDGHLLLDPLHVYVSCQPNFFRTRWNKLWTEVVRVTSKVVAEVGKDVAHPGVAPLDGDPENIKWFSSAICCVFFFMHLLHLFVCLLRKSSDPQHHPFLWILLDASEDPTVLLFLCHLDPWIQFSVFLILLHFDEQAPQVLPVGLLHPLLPGHPLLYTQVPHLYYVSKRNCCLLQHDNDSACYPSALLHSISLWYLDDETDYHHK